MYNSQIPTANKKLARAEIYGTFGEHFQASTNKDGSMNPDKLNLISLLIESEQERLKSAICKNRPP